MEIYKQKNARVSPLSHQIKTKISHNSLTSYIIISTSALLTLQKKFPRKPISFGRGVNIENKKFLKKSVTFGFYLIIIIK